MITSEHKSKKKKALYNESIPGLANGYRVSCCASEQAKKILRITGSISSWSWSLPIKEDLENILKGEQTL